jgi:AraC-like DNA-binding protein
MSGYVGIDVHRKRCQVAVIDAKGEVLANRNVPNGVEPVLKVIGGLPPGTPAAPPISYLTRLRLARAAGYLATTTKNVGHVAHLVGYESEASFSKAFRRAFGRPPGDYRRGRFAAPNGR